MASCIKRGESLFIPFRNGQSIMDSQLKPRMYKSMQNFAKAFPTHNYGTENIEVVEYAEVKHGEWKLVSETHQMFDDVDEIFFVECPFCQRREYVEFDLDIIKMFEYAREHYLYCNCGAKMDGKE